MGQIFCADALCNDHGLFSVGRYSTNEGAHTPPRRDKFNGPGNPYGRSVVCHYDHSPQWIIY